MLTEPGIEGGNTQKMLVGGKLPTKTLNVKLKSLKRV